MSEADELIARLAAEGELEGTGGFTLDPAVALAKLREHQLRDPTLFVLSWVRVAVLLGATRIDVEIDADDVWLRFDGESLTDADFDHLWAAGVGTRGSTHAQASRELALGINGVFCWGAKSVTVIGGALQVELDRAFTMRRSKLAEPSPGNVFHAKRPLGLDLVRRRLLDRRGELPEELLLARACAYATVRINLEGKPLDRDWVAQREPWVVVTIDDGERHGVLLLHEQGVSQLHVLKAGVQVATIELPYPYVEAVIDDRLLPLDLSQEKPVEGERWASLLDCVARARWQAWFQLAAREQWCGPPQHRHHRALLEAVLASPDLRWAEIPRAREFADRTECATALHNPFGGFRSLADQRADLLQPFPMPGPLRPTLAELLDRIRQFGAVFTSASARWELPIVPALPVLHGSLPGSHWRPLEQPEHLTAYRRAAQQLRPLHGEELLRRGWPSLSFTHDEHVVRVAWLRGVEGRQGGLILGRGRERLAEFRLPERWGPLWAEVEGPFAEAPELPLDRQVATAVLAMLSRYHELVLAVLAQPEPHEHELVHEYLRDAFGRWSARRLLELTHIPADQLALAIGNWRGDWGVPREWSDPPEQGASTAHPLAEVPWLAQGDRTVSFRELRAASDRGPLCWIDRDDPLAEDIPAEVWRLSAAERRHIEILLPNALRPFDIHAWARSDPDTQTLPATLDDARHTLRFEGQADMRGILALPEREVPSAWSHPTRRSARLQVLAHGHALGFIDVPLPLGPFYGVIELPQARPLPHCDRIAKDETWRAAAAVIEFSAHSLARTQLAAWRERCEQPDELARARDWIFDLERGAWPELAAELTCWIATLPIDHPLRRASP